MGGVTQISKVGEIWHRSCEFLGSCSFVLHMGRLNCHFWAPFLFVLGYFCQNVAFYIVGLEGLSLREFFSGPILALSVDRVMQEGEIIRLDFLPPTFFQPSKCVCRAHTKKD